MRIALTAFLLGCAAPFAVSAQTYDETYGGAQPQQQYQQQQSPTLGSFAPNQTTTTSGPVYQQDITQEMPAAPNAVETPAALEDYYAPAPVPTFEVTKYAVLQTLDKVTARTATVTLPVGKPSAVGPLFVDVKTCQKTPPTEQPEAAVFIQVWEAKPKAHGIQSEKQESQWVFSGWMFASSPALSAMNHPIYDVWVKDCTNEAASASTPKSKATEAAPSDTDKDTEKAATE